MIPQIGVLLPNRPGQMKKVTEIMAEHEINCISLSTQESRSFGTLYAVVDQPEKLEALLEEKGFLYVREEIVAICMENKAGYMNQILSDLGRANINIDSIYTFYSACRQKPVMLCRADGLSEVEMFLEGRGYEVFKNTEELLGN